MTKVHFPLLQVTTKDLSQALQQLQVLIINTEQTDALQTALQNLYAHQSLKVGYLSCKESILGAIIELCIKEKVVVIVAGTTYFYAPNETFSACLISPTATMDNKSLCQQLFEHPQLDLFSIIGNQLYLSEPQSIKKLQEQYFEMFRLGALRDKPNIAEPSLRESQQAYFDMNVVRNSDAPESTQQYPNGLHAEEICQLARYAGMSDNMHYINIAGYTYNIKASSLTMQLVALLIWHLIDGIANRRIEDTAFYEQNQDLKKIIINIDQHQLLFLNSKISHRWWVKIPLNDNLYRWLSCLYDDYQTACRHEVPSRWLWFYQKLKKK